MTSPPSPSISFIEHTDGSVTVTAHRLPVRIHTDAIDRWRDETWKPVPFECFSCHKTAMYKTDFYMAGEELGIVTYQCTGGNYQAGVGCP